MYVSRIEMTGFKSFVDRTVVELGPGIASVVGPNGCGKTNICDAIRWVLGEENVRLLRGSRIEDVIFAGTELRKPTGMAEVSLTLTDVQDVLPVDYDEVTVSRRVFRSGESQFFINKVPSRLKDIVNLFLGTGMGRRAYSVMERDMIDWILDDNNGQRRKIIEEAAGISKYKVRRKETISKLELTHRDLERVEDLISEVERRVRQLSRQAAKARRYDRLVNRIKEVETYGSVKEYNGIQHRHEGIIKELESVETQLSGLASDISTAEADIEHMKLDMLGVEDEISSFGKEMAEVTDQVQKAENDKVVASERKRTIDERLAEISRGRDAKQHALKQKLDLLESKRRERGVNSGRLETLISANGELEEEYKKAESELKTRREQSVVSAQETIANVKRHVDAASAITEARSTKAHLTELLQKSESKHRGLLGRIDGIQVDIEALETELADLGTSFSREERELSELTGVIDEVTAKIEQIRQKRSELGEKAAKASSRYDVFKELVERYEGYKSGVRALMQEGKETRHVHGVIGDMVKCTDARYEPAVAAALSDAIQYVVVESKDHAVDSVKMLKDGNKGSATMVLLDRIPRAASQEKAAEPQAGVIARVIDFVECEARYRELLEYMLRDVFVVESLDEAFDLSNRSGDHTCSFVTPEGDAIFRGSFVRSGGNGDSSDVLIGRREKVAGLATEADALRSLAQEQDKAFEELNASLKDLVLSRNAKQQSQVEARAVIADKEKILHSRTSERDSLRSALAELEEEIVKFKTTLDDVERRIAEAPGDLHLLDVPQGELFDPVSEHDELETRVTELRKRFEENRREVLRLQSSNGFIEETIARLEGETGSLEQEITDLDENQRALAAKKADLSKIEESLSSEVHGLLSLLGESDAKRKEALERKHDLESRIEDARKRIKASQAGREEHLGRKQELKSESGLLEMRADSLRQRIIDDYDVDISQVSLDDLTECENCEEELVKLKAHLKNLGPVNLVALDEYDIEKERYDFLKDQRDDLIKARESLDEAIIQINRRAKAEFVETFAKVRKDFRKNFQTLFEGGDADLRVRYEADPLESPVDILAQPSGKKLEHISLLSGGERALTAIAFLFAVYYTKPSPFCLLDEVDAPLDDANVLRFVNLIRDFSTHTQFLMVTHNKKTMEAASCLYGVTMEEPGVSRIVSVKIEREKDGVLEPVG